MLLSDASQTLASWGPLMPSKTLKDRFIAGVRVRTRATFFDTKVRGLALRVTPNGGKTWSFVYRTNGQPTQWFRLAEYPAVKLAEARRLALDARHAVDVDGRDPAAERRTAKATPPPEPIAPAFTFADLVKVYETFAKGRKKTWEGDLQKIAKYLTPAWGSLPLRSITRTHVHELLDTLVANGLTVGVNRIQALISRLFTVALDRSLIDAHPAARMIKRFAEHAGDRVLNDDELRALWAGLDAQPGAAADAVRLRALLGQRGGEIAGMEWRELDLSAGLWELPGRRTKNRRPHAVPLPSLALALLERRRAAVAEDEPRVFPGLTLTGDAHKSLAGIRGGAYEWKDLRRTVATRLADLGFDETTIGRTLNHARHTVTSKHYNKHTYAAEKRQALEGWDREIERILTKQPKAGAAVLPHAPRRRG
jgi:integrase